MTQVRVEVLDARGQRVGSLISLDGQGIAVEGPIVGAHSFSYHQRGTIIDKPGELSFAAPLTLVGNDALATGNHLKVYEDSIEMGEYIITTTSETLAANGREGQYTCPDLLDELRRTSVSSGFIADLGHVSTGAGDPIPARNPETLMSVFGRLVNLRGYITGDTLTAWSIGDTRTFPVGLDGLQFGVFGISVLEAIGKLAHDRFSHYKLGLFGRTVSFGHFGEASGIRLIKPSRTPYLTEENDEVRQITGFTRTNDGNFVNDIVPVGAGNGATILTLQPLYALNGNWGTLQGYDPRFPIKRRVRWDFGGLDGYDYYIDTSNYNNSIARYGLSQAIYQESSIGPTQPGNASDLQVAAATLYVASVAHLLWYCQPHETFAITTAGRGDLRDIGGKTVTVVYRELDADGATLRDINKIYYVNEVKRSWGDNGAGTDTWTLSTLGRWEQDGFSVFSGALQQLDYFRVTPTIYPTRESIYYDCLVAASHPASVYLDQDNSVVRMIEATFSVTCLPAVAPITGTDPSSVAGAHFHNIIGNLPVVTGTDNSINHSAPGGQAAFTHSDSIGVSRTGAVLKVGGVSKSGTATKTGAVANGNINSSPGVGIAVSGDPVPSDATALVGKTLTGGTFGLWAAGGGSRTIRSSIVLDVNNTNHGHGDTIGVNDGIGVLDQLSVADTISPYKYGGVDQHGGFAPAVNSHGFIGSSGYGLPFGNISTAYSTSTDGAHTHKMAYGYYLDPTGTASGVTISVNGTRVDTYFAGTGYAVGPYSGAFTVDLAYIGVIPVQGAVRIDFESATFGRLLIRGKIRRHETTVAAHT